MEHPVTCQECHHHHKLLERARELMPGDEKLFELAEVFKVFGDSTRVRIMCALMGGEMCVCDISGLLGMTGSAISHQLRLLKSHRLVKSRREGKSVIYSLDDQHISSILIQGLSHIEEAQP
ncbi:MAG: metalloregulator ArsR/SmtB family transcription factor [Oscillospiraceae bacterium]|jgi:ArsR family transcriptional regulator|nr:metalloregulator ArsR/SmtB family transcription factor [Oscillospiraceae bacterium]